MKYTRLAVATLLSFTGMAHSQTFTTWIGENNNSLQATGTNANVYGGSGGWKDIGVRQGLGPDNSSPLQFNAETIIAEEQGITVFGFQSTGLNAASVLSASLYVNLENVIQINDPNGIVNFGIYGIPAARAGFDENDTDYFDINDGSLINSYGSFSISGNDSLNNTWFNYDVTTAFRDYLNGAIGGIAFAIRPGATPGGSTFTGSDFSVQFKSQETPNGLESPGLLVTSPVPEPSAALLLLSSLGVTSLLRRRRA